LVVATDASRHSLKKGICGIYGHIWTKLLPGSLARERMRGLLEPDNEVPGLSYRTQFDVLARRQFTSICSNSRPT
jgi:hypothetical protein